MEYAPITTTFTDETLQLLERLQEQPGQHATPVKGAGMLLSWVFWKNSFEALGWLQDGQFKPEHLSSAAFWLTRLGDPHAQQPSRLSIRLLDLPETWIPNAEPSVHKLESHVTMIEQVLDLWSILKPTLRDEFCELFLHREGVLMEGATGLKVQLTSAPYDVLRNQQPVPWPISFIRFPWSYQSWELAW